MLKARRYHICGQVQDVGFRIFAQEIALREGLQGFVANCSDGSVEAEVEGEDTSIERFAAQIAQIDLFYYDNANISIESQIFAHMSPEQTTHFLSNAR